MLDKFLLTFFICWTILGLSGFCVHVDVFKESVKKNISRIRLAIYLFLCGPIVWVGTLFSMIYLVYKVFVYWLLQTEPNEIEKNNYSSRLKEMING